MKKSGFEIGNFPIQFFSLEDKYLLTSRLTSSLEFFTWGRHSSRSRSTGMADTDSAINVAAWSAASTSGADN